MSSDRTPADVIADAIVVGRAVSNSPRALARRALDALAAAGFRVTPEPDDTTRPFTTSADRRRLTHIIEVLDNGQDASITFTHAQMLRRLLALAEFAAGGVEGSEDRADRCPTCDSDDVTLRLYCCDSCNDLCDDAWHVGGSGDTR